ncbi:MAG TPA: TPM domain-containing protein, partial [Verrucomicrobiae bacterium]|nr:TPM domain-containing protein [Verrucomicrobiae bacterium]
MHDSSQTTAALGRAGTKVNRAGRPQTNYFGQAVGPPAPVLWLAWLALCLLSGGSLVELQAAEVMPPAPKQYFNDYAHVVRPAEAARLNTTLENFERQTSDQILVVIYPKMQSDSSIEDYTVRLAQSWKVGQQGKDNGAVLFVFVQDRKLYLQVGYGLEGALPDALAKRIIENEIKPRFRSGDYDRGLDAGVTAILAAVKGEYKGTGHTAAEGKHPAPAPVILLL